ncbi:MAG: hypothetical protein K6G55_03285 [Selenomonadaceae bacterium]|nr:hypothetical protein [Selenomonadaceae bacterium]
MQKGIATIEIIIVTMIIGILMTAAIPNAKNLFDRVSLDYETKKLYGDLRYLQTVNRAATVQMTGTSRTDIQSQNLKLKIIPLNKKYRFMSGKVVFGDEHTIRNIKSINLNFDINVDRDELIFNHLGQLTNNQSVLSGNITYTSRFGRKTAIVFDSVGRIRAKHFIRENN